MGKRYSKQIERGSSDHVQFGENVEIGFYTCIGVGATRLTPTRIGDNVKIGSFCILYGNVTIDSNVTIGDYCLVSHGTKIGNKTRVLYGAKLFDSVRVGERCIIGSDLSDRTIVEDEVTFLGKIAHSHRNPNGDWDETEEPSPVIKHGSVIGVDAILLGGISVGPGAYVAAGEIARFDIPPNSVLYKGEISKIEDWRGVIKARSK